MSESEFYVEVTYPKTMWDAKRGSTFCSWHKRPRFNVPLHYEQPAGSKNWEDTFGPFDSLVAAEKFMQFTFEKLSEWSNTTEGEKFSVAIFQSDLKTEEKRLDGTVGTNKP